MSPSVTTGAAPTASEQTSLAPGCGLPERSRVAWRRRVDEGAMLRAGRTWTAWTVAHSLPFSAAAVALAVFKPVLIPISLLLLAHAWGISALYAHRGIAVLRPRTLSTPGPEARALLLLGDLVNEENRRLHARTGLVLQPGELGTWVIGEAGALLVRPGGHRVNCYCVRVTDSTLPHGDRIAHLLLALRCDEPDFTTIANLAFSGARWRVRRRLPAQQRAALDAAVTLGRATPRPVGPRVPAAATEL